MDDLFKEKWLLIARKTEWRPLILSSHVFRSNERQWTIKEGLWIKAVGPLIAILLGLLTFYAFFFHYKQLDGWSIFGVVLSSLFIWTGVYYLFSANKLQFDQSNSLVYLYYGLLLCPRILEIPQELVELTLDIITEGKGWRSRLQKGSVVLSMTLKEKSDLPAINIMIENSREEMDEIFQQISKSFDDARDMTIVDESLPDGQIVQMFKTGISNSSQQSSSMTSSYNNELEQLVFRRSFYKILPWLVVLLFGTGGVCFMLFTGALEESWVPIIFMAGFLLFAGFGAVGLLIGFGTTKVIVDMSKEMLVVRKGLSGTGFGVTEFEFQQICGFQVCCRRFSGEDTEFTVFELNLVLYGKPFAERINIQSDGNESRIFVEAEQLSNLVNKPLFYHT